MGNHSDFASQSGDFDEAIPYLAEARRLAPQVWSDGRLEAEELR